MFAVVIMIIIIGDELGDLPWSIHPFVFEKRLPKAVFPIRVVFIYLLVEMSDEVRKVWRSERSAFLRACIIQITLSAVVKPIIIDTTSHLTLLNSWEDKAGNGLLSLSF